MNREKPRCSGNSKAGKPCGAAPTSSGLCFFHSQPAKAVELGRIGGRKNGRLPSHDTSLVLTSQDARTARDTLAFLYENVLNRRIGPAQATALIKITELRLKLEERTDLSKVEKLYEELKQAIETRDVESAEPEDPFAEAEQEAP